MHVLITIVLAAIVAWGAVYISVTVLAFLGYLVATPSLVGMRLFNVLGLTDPVWSLMFHLALGGLLGFWSHLARPRQAKMLLVGAVIGIYIFAMSVVGLTPSSDQEPVEAAEASFQESPGANLPPSAPEEELGTDRSAELQELDPNDTRSSDAAAPPSDQRKRTDSPPPERSSNRIESPSAPERKDGSVEQRTGALTIRASPSSDIELDGTEVGATNANGFLVLSGIRSGRHVIVARKVGHTEATSIVEVQEGQGYVVELDLTALPGRLTVTANVPGVLVRVGDAGEHPLPLNGLDLPAGSYRVTASRDGFRPVVKDLEIRPGTSVTVEFVLVPVRVGELLRAAEKPFARGDLPAAAEAARSVIKTRPVAGAAHRLLGLALYEQRRFDDSSDPLIRVIDLGEEVELSTKHRHGGGGFR